MSGPPRAEDRASMAAETNLEPAADRASVSEEELMTGFIPTFRPPAGGDGGLGEDAVAALQVGQRLGDFELLSVLGSGAFARVFLARQLSLDRDVALKVSANKGLEARTLASLEHEHIVQVFSEEVDSGRDLRWMCMQFVPGTTLERVIRALWERESLTWDGVVLLKLVDRLSTRTVPFDASALHGRQVLAHCNQEESVCWIGARLAEALGYAHERGVLHRDIKPANILLNPYGRPFLADFNISLDADRKHGSSGAIFGGTLGYMSPEHLDAFNPDEATTPDAVDERSDIFALGVVLTELFTGRNPYGEPPAREVASPSLQALAADRRIHPPALNMDSRVPPVLRRILRRCLEPEPSRRYAKAIELAGALDGCRGLSDVSSELGRLGSFTRLVEVHPFAAMLILAIVPQIISSAVNISYNQIRIVNDFNAAQQSAFVRIVLVYNAVLYPVCLFLIYRLTARSLWVWKQLERTRTVDATAVDAARQQMLRLPARAVGLAVLGWLPGAILFPVVIDASAGPLGWPVYGHFAISFTISGLIALTYSYFGVQFIVLRGLYPKLWSDGRDFPAVARRELANRERGLNWFQLLAGAIPLAGAIMVMSVGPEQMAQWASFRWLVIALIITGLLGFAIANAAVERLTRILRAFQGAKGGNA